MASEKILMFRFLLELVGGTPNTEHWMDEHLFFSLNFFFFLRFVVYIDSHLLLVSCLSSMSNQLASARYLIYSLQICVSTRMRSPFIQRQETGKRKKNWWILHLWHQPQATRTAEKWWTDSPPMTPTSGNSNSREMMDWFSTYDTNLRQLEQQRNDGLILHLWHQPQATRTADKWWTDSPPMTPTSGNSNSRQMMDWFSICDNQPHSGFTRLQKFATFQTLQIFATFWKNKRTTKKLAEPSVEMCP